MSIRENVAQLLREVPEGVLIVAAAKSRSPDEIVEAVEAGISVIGENYVQEAELAFSRIGRRARWHFIGHLQKNKVKKAIEIFDMIETVDSVELAREIDRRCAQAGKVMPVLIEVNSAREAGKAGVYPENAEGLIREIARLSNIRVMGLMTMGPAVTRPEEARPYFAETRELSEHIRKMGLPNVEMRYLSMGMSATYRIAIEEGASIIRIGTRIFGERP
ncbi:MAG: YggS family pyridoxal phosphate-dependent enzyme [Dehalococcoidales bacterium]|nr:YggS family pyridoxal phosphate-dependent enzyme [Dehalococcoidales bacterium]